MRVTENRESISSLIIKISNVKGRYILKDNKFPILLSIYCRTQVIAPVDGQLFLLLSCNIGGVPHAIAINKPIYIRFLLNKII